MDTLHASRRLVKSPPELWAEVSDEAALARHLADFGEIRITRVAPETTVAWEGDRASGTVEIEAAGWGTKVVLTATPAAEAPVTQAPEPQPEPEAPEPQPRGPEPTPDARQPDVTPAATEDPGPVPVHGRRGFFARLFRRQPRAGTRVAEAPAPSAPAPDPAPPAPTPQPGPLPGPQPVPDPPAAEPEPPAVELPDEPPPAAAAAEQLARARTVAILTGVLDDLGAAHHRPFSRG